MLEQDGADTSAVLPWWRDPEKLLAWKKRALRDASDRDLLSELVDRAQRNERFRRDVKSKMEALGSGRKGQPRPLGEAEHVVAAFGWALERMRLAGNRASVERAADWLVAGPFHGRSRAGLIRIYQKFRQK